MTIDTDIKGDCLPCEGQFIAVWEHDGKIWSATLRWIKGQLHMHDIERDEWVTTTATWFKRQTLTILAP